MSNFKFREMDINPTTAAEIRECETPEGMRVRLRRYTYSNSMVRHVFLSAEARGLSGEDTMTWLAFEALKRMEKLEDIELERARLEPMPPFVIDEKKLLA